MAEFFSPLWEFLFEKLGTGGIFLATLAPFIMLALGVFAIVLLVAMIKGIFRAIKKARCNKFRQKAQSYYYNEDYNSSYICWMKLNKLTPLSAEEMYTVSQVCACGEDEFWAIEDKNATEEYWLEKCLDKEYPLAFFTLGKKFCTENNGDTLRAAMGVAYIRTAANLGLKEAKEQVATIDKANEALPKNSNKEILFAASKGDIHSQYLIATGKCRDNMHSSIDWGELAAEQGHSESQYQIAMWNLMDEGKKPNLKYALSLLERSANQNHAGAMLLLGQLYMGQKGVNRNDKKAIEYLKNAAEHGEPDGYYYISKIYSRQHIELVDKKGLSRLDALHDKECLYLFDESLSYMVKAEFAGSEKAKKIQ